MPAIHISPEGSSAWSEVDRVRLSQVGVSGYTETPKVYISNQGSTAWSLVHDSVPPTVRVIRACDVNDELWGVAESNAPRRLYRFRWTGGLIGTRAISSSVLNGVIGMAHDGTQLWVLYEESPGVRERIYLINTTTGATIRSFRLAMHTSSTSGVSIRAYSIGNYGSNQVMLSYSTIGGHVREYLRAVIGLATARDYSRWTGIAGVPNPDQRRIESNGSDIYTASVFESTPMVGRVYRGAQLVASSPDRIADIVYRSSNASLYVITESGLVRRVSRHSSLLGAPTTLRVPQV